ncbi:hypothetical protein NC652_027481 [Populus alba x Populus x berolinensis]|nr:hypothetical protein NC652_027481 [Populus alba x Populus x berolinensis]
MSDCPYLSPSGLCFSKPFLNLNIAFQTLSKKKRRYSSLLLRSACWQPLFAMPTKYSSDPSHSCQKMRKGVFRAGAAFVVLTGTVSELYYVSYSKANDGQLSYNGDTGTSESIEFVSLSWKLNALHGFSLHVNSSIQNLLADIPDQVRPHGYLASCFVMDPKNWT